MIQLSLERERRFRRSLFMFCLKREIFIFKSYSRAGTAIRNEQKKRDAPAKFKRCFANLNLLHFFYVSSCRQRILLGPYFQGRAPLLS